MGFHKQIYLLRKGFDRKVYVPFLKMSVHPTILSSFFTTRILHFLWAEEVWTSCKFYLMWQGWGITWKFNSSQNQTLNMKTLSLGVPWVVIEFESAIPRFLWMITGRNLDLLLSIKTEKIANLSQLWRPDSTKVHPYFCKKNWYFRSKVFFGPWEIVKKEWKRVFIFVKKKKILFSFAPFIKSKNLGRGEGKLKNPVWEEKKA